MMRPCPRPSRIVASLAGVLLASAGAPAQLKEHEVLVVYDSRIADSAEVARYYAGSAKVPGGATPYPGTRPGVRVVDLASLPGAGLGVVDPDIDYGTFVGAFREPLRAYLAQQGLTRTVRCLVMTRGLPHRIENSSSPPSLGDSPGSAGGAFFCTSTPSVDYASVDSELTLLQQDLSVPSPATNVIASRRGMILNPYWKSVLPLGAYDTSGISGVKQFVLPGGGYQCSAGGPVFSFNGLHWNLTPAPGGATAQLTPGDVYLVTRLDASSVPAVFAMLDRAAAFVASSTGSAFVLDRDAQGFDSSSFITSLHNGADYQQTSTLLSTTDRRYSTGSVRFNAADAWSGFVVGPNLSFAPNSPVVVSAPVLLLASYGANHSTTAVPAPPAEPARVFSTPFAATWATGFTFAPGAAFNTYESYNGRAFNGLGQNPFVVQQQAADALGHGATGTSGATFAIAHVWEPFAFTVADNVFIAQNFYLGGLSWAEAAWSSIPVLSWQHVVLGDPLARVRRSREDVNADGRVDLDDLYAWRAAPVDLNNSGLADEADYRLLEGVVRGAELTNMKTAR
jgi:hypothetical protein